MRLRIMTIIKNRKSLVLFGRVTYTCTWRNVLNKSLSENFWTMLMRFDTSSLLFVWHKYLRAAKSHGKNRGPISPVRSGSDRIGSEIGLVHLYPGSETARRSGSQTAVARRGADV